MPGTRKPSAPDPHALLLKMREEPLVFAKILWPDVRWSSKQIEVIESVRDNYCTVVPAGHQLGKDFTSGFIALWYFLTNWEVRVITTSVKDDHLRVLWGEIGRFVETARKDTILGPIRARDGGPLITNHRDIRKLRADKTECHISYLRGMVSEKGEGMAGHHAAATLLIADEASGLDNVVFDQGEGWAKRILVIGNPYHCRNRFYEWVKQGDVLYPDE